MPLMKATPVFVTTIKSVGHHGQTERLGGMDGDGRRAESRQTLLGRG